MVRVDRDRLPVHRVNASRKQFGDRHDENSLVAGFRSRRSERRRAPPGPVNETFENFGSTPSLNSRRISLAEATVPPTAGVAFSS